MNQLLNQIGDWNPQLLRELKGRLKFRSVAVTVAGSVVFQLLFILSFWQSLPREGQRYSRYCLDTATPCTVNWPIWWQDQFRFIAWLLPFIFFAAGVYALVADLTQEERRGTLNFIRLSPRSCFSILVGKLLGVPILSYLGVALIVPLHVVAAINAGTPIGFLVSYYVLLLATGIFLFSAAVLQALWSGDRILIAGRISSGPILLAFVTLWLTNIYMFWNLSTTWSSFSRTVFAINSIPDFQWFYLQLAENPFTSHIFTLAVLGIGTYGVWQLVKRRFNSPSATAIGKKQSYYTVAFLEVFCLGFCLYSGNPPDRLIYLAQFGGLYVFNFICFLILIASLSTQRQALLDWVRYGLQRGGLVRDLIWADKSPAPIAIAVNLIIANALLIPWVSLWNDSTYKLKGILALVLFSTTMLVYATIVQLILSLKIQRPVVWAWGTIVSITILPPIFLSLLSLTPERVPLLWIILGLPVYPSGAASEANLVVGIVVQAIIAIALGFRLATKLQQLSTDRSGTLPA
ncbi:hypothetical protein [Pseudanabaena sp. PCC 6802]|uniref:hypothetical protein n=1 Tax=Pseudanabaena sp. PCC 6802 TaxID=118173 RepID=UPI000347498D|nr:hypothetical protein [Pseudanabaena sp. PCC 6802]